MIRPTIAPNSTGTPAGICGHAHHEKCGICLEEDMEIPAQTGFSSDKCSVRLACGHTFHSDCMKNNLTHGTSNCPMCRTPLEDYEINNINEEFGIELGRRTPHDMENDLSERDYIELRDNVRATQRQNQGLDASELDFGFMDDLLRGFTMMGLSGPTLEEQFGLWLEENYPEFDAEAGEEIFEPEPQQSSYYSYYLFDPAPMPLLPSDWTWQDTSDLLTELDIILSSLSSPVVYSQSCSRNAFEPLFPAWSQPMFGDFRPMLLVF